MSLYTKPSITMNGLVFYYDMTNTNKSWIGRPTTNLCSSNGIHTNWNNSGTATWSSDDPYVPRLLPTVPVISMYKDTAGNSHIANGYATLSAGLSYTVSMYVYIPNNVGTLAGAQPYMRTFPANTSRGILLYNGSSDWNTWPKDRWIRISNTFTNSANDTEHYISCYLDNAGNKIYMTAPMVEQSSVLSSYLAVSSTRSNTQALRDLTNNNTITVNSLTYASNETFSFNGTSNNLSIGSFGGYSTNITCEAWFKTTSAATWKNIVCGPNGDLIFSINGNLVNFGCQGNAPIPHANFSTTVVNTGNWFHAAATYNGSSVNIYVNGNLESTNARSGNITPGAKNIGSSSGGGSEYFNGTIDNVKIYNRALSNLEIKQNFQALRSRFGV